MKEAILIRPAVSTDIPELMAVDHGYNTDHVWQMALDNGSEHFEVAFRQVRLPRPMRVSYPRDPQLLADEWTRRAALMVAELEDRCVGYVALVEGPAPGSAWITDLVVDTVHRRRGIALRLLASADRWCREQGIDSLVLEVQSKNYPGIRLARKARFEFCGYSDQYYPDQDIALFFARSLK